MVLPTHFLETRDCYSSTMKRAHVFSRGSGCVQYIGRLSVDCVSRMVIDYEQV